MPRGNNLRIYSAPTIAAKKDFGLRLIVAKNIVPPGLSNLAHSFTSCHCVVNGDTLEQHKPHPAPLLHACTLTNSQAERTVYIGDVEDDMRAANSAGCYALAVDYGYHALDSHPNEWQTHAVISHANQLLPTLENIGKNTPPLRET